MSHCFQVLAPCFIFPLPRRLKFVRMLLWLFSGVPCQRGYLVRIPLHRVRFLQKSTKRKTNKRCVTASLARVKFAIYCWWWIHHASVLSLLVFLYYYILAWLTSWLHNVYGPQHVERASLGPVHKLRVRNLKLQLISLQLGLPSSL